MLATAVSARSLMRRCVRSLRCSRYTAASFSITARPLQQQLKPRAVPLSQLSETYLDGTSAVYVENLYQEWQQNPEAVPRSWSQLFQAVEADVAPGKAYAAAPRAFASSEVSQAELEKSVTLTIKAVTMIRAFQVRGHFLANLDPLHLTELSKREIPSELKLSTYGAQP